MSHGKKLGSTLGFPTVNLRLKENVLSPAKGVYATKVILENGETHPAVTNVGTRPTVDDGNQLTIEGFILDFQGDLYGQKIQMEFYKYLREERKFPSFAALTAEVMHNAEQTREYFGRPSLKRSMPPAGLTFPAGGMLYFVPGSAADEQNAHHAGAYAEDLVAGQYLLIPKYPHQDQDTRQGKVGHQGGHTDLPSRPVDQDIAQLQAHHGQPHHHGGPVGLADLLYQVLLSPCGHKKQQQGQCRRHPIVDG